MNINLCASCPRDENVMEGNCNRAKPDGFVARCGPPWTIRKHKFVEGYCKIFTKAMPGKFPQMSFIDLFAGPGLYYKWPSGEIFKGSPLIALEFDFKRYFFIDIGKDNIDALRERANGKNDVEYLNMDANTAGRILNNKLAKNSLNFCLADPDNMSQLHFNTLKELASNKRRVDLLINFPYWMYFKRAAGHLIKDDSESNAINLYFGTNYWRDIFIKYEKRFTDELFQDLLNLYLTQFYDIGYVKPEGKYWRNYEVIKNTRGNPIYAMLFLSKNRLGYKLWNEMVKYAKEIDQRLDL